MVEEIEGRMGERDLKEGRRGWRDCMGAVEDWEGREMGVQI